MLLPLTYRLNVSVNPLTVHSKLEHFDQRPDQR